MLEKTSKYFALKLCSFNKSNDSDILEIVAYGIEIMLAAIINVVLVLIISAMFNRFVETVTFLCVFMPLRTYSGGFHAKTHVRCFFILLCCVIFEWLIIDVFMEFDLIYVGILVLLVSSIVIILLTPIEHKNKPLTKKHISHSRFVCRIILSIIWIISTALYFNKIPRILFPIIYGCAVTAISMLVVIIINHYKKEETANEKA